MIEIKLFAVVRERLGVESLELDLEELEEPTVEAALAVASARFPALEELLPHLRIALDHEFVTLDAELHGDAEIALIPPVSGGSSERGSSDGRFRVTQEPLDSTEVVSLVRRTDAGAVITFEGTVRDHTDDHAVAYLVYEAYPEMALKKLLEVADAAAERWPCFVAIHHRYGRLELGETAVIIAVSTPHRADGYAASSWIIDRLKEEVPIWKKEVGPGGSTWVGFGP